MEYIEYIIVAAVALWIGWHARGIIILANMSTNPDRMIKILQEIKKINDAESRGEMDVQGIDVDATEIRIEHVNGAVYAYAMDNGTFLAQGSTLDDTLKAVAERFPDQKFWHKENNQSSQTA